MRTFVSSAGSESVIVAGVPVYSGSMYFSSVERYLTLSLASLVASVTWLSSPFQRWSTRLFARPSTENTARQAGCFNCSVIEFSLVMRVRQYSSSVDGPLSSGST